MRNFEVFFLTLIKSVFFFSIIMLKYAILIGAFLLLEKKLTIFGGAITGLYIPILLVLLKRNDCECGLLLLWVGDVNAELLLAEHCEHLMVYHHFRDPPVLPHVTLLSQQLMVITVFTFSQQSSEERPITYTRFIWIIRVLEFFWLLRVLDFD